MKNSTLTIVVSLALILFAIGIFFAVKPPKPHELPPVSQPSTSASVLPPAPVEQFVLTYSCRPKTKRFDSKQEALQFKNTLVQWGFIAEYKEYTLRPFPPSRNDLHDVFPGNQRDDKVYYVNYRADRIERVYATKEAAETAALNLALLGCDGIEIHGN